MKKIARKPIVKGFTVGRTELNLKIKYFMRAFLEQNHYQDPVKFIADKLVETGFIDNESLLIAKRYTLVNKYLIKEDFVFSLQDSYERYHRRPNPNYNYDYNGPTDLEDFYAS